MVTLGLDEARAGIAELLDHVEKGDDVLITGRSDPIVKPAERPTMREALRRLADSRDNPPPWSAPNADLLRELRDGRL